MSDWLIPHYHLPPQQRSVLVVVRRQDGSKSRLRAIYVAPGSVPCPENYIDAEAGHGGWWVRGGWYEDSYYCGHAPIPDRVLRWMPLPEFPPEVYGIDYGPTLN